LLTLFVFFLNEDGFAAIQAALFCSQCSKVAFHGCVRIAAALRTLGCDDGQELLHHHSITTTVTANRRMDMNGSGITGCKVADFNEALFHVAKDLTVAAHQNDVPLAFLGECAHGHTDSDTALIAEIYHLVVNDRIVAAIDFCSS